MRLRRTSPKSRRSPARKALIAFNCLLAMIIVGGVSAIGYGNWRLAQFERVPTEDALVQRADSPPGAPLNILVVGSDSRADLAPGQARQFGTETKVPGRRSDTMMVVHLDPTTKRTAVLSIPRDTYVTLADSGTKDRLNAVYETSEANLIRTITNNFGIPIDHFVQVDFNGFKDIVSAVGGVNVPFATPVRDFDADPKVMHTWTGLNIAQQGCVKLSGDQALAYVRSRHYQVFENGRWRTDGSGDFGRIKRQQDFVRRVVSKSAAAARNPLTLNSLLASGTKNVKFDEGLDTTELIGLITQFSSIDPSTTDMMTVPTTNAMIGGRSLELPKQPETRQAVERLLNGSPAAASTAESSTTSSVPTTTTTTTAPSRFVPHPLQHVEIEL